MSISLHIKIRIGEEFLMNEVLYKNRIVLKPIMQNQQNN